MAAQHGFASRFKVGGTLTATTATVLSDPTGTYGIKRDSDDAVVVSSGTSMTNDATGVYSYLYTAGGSGVVVAPAVATAYTAYVKHTYSGANYYDQIRFTIASSGYLTLTTIRQYVRELALNATELDYDNTKVDLAFKIAAEEYMEHTAPDFAGGSVAVTDASNVLDFSGLTGFSPVLLAGMLIDTNYPVHTRPETWIRRQIVDDPQSGRPQFVGFTSESGAICWPTPDADYTLNVDFENVLTSWTAGTSSPDDVSINIPPNHAVKIATLGAPVILQYGDGRSTYGRPEWKMYLDWIDGRARRRTKSKTAVRDPLRHRVSETRARVW